MSLWDQATACKLKFHVIITTSNTAISRMRNGVKHMVLTPEPCLAVGGHFFSAATLFPALQAFVLEHFFGDSIVNTTHTGSPAILLRLFLACMKTDVDDTVDQLYEIYSEERFQGKSNAQLNVLSLMSPFRSDTKLWQSLRNATHYLQHTVAGAKAAGE